MSLQYSDTTNKLGIIQAEESYCELGDAGISGNSTLLKEFTRHNNVVAAKVWAWIFAASGFARYDDSNQTNLPQATQDISSGTGKYALPSEALTVVGAEFLRETGGTWTKLLPITDKEWTESYPAGEFGKDSGTPTYYKWLGDTLIFDLIPDFSVTAGLKIYFDRGSVSFASSDTTKTPGFAGEFHNVIPVGGSLEWLKVHKPDSAALRELKEDWLNYERAIKSFYAERWRDYAPKITPFITEFR
jgi:hypothetical protein